MNRLFEAFQYNERRATIAGQIIVLLMITCLNVVSVMAAGWVSGEYDRQGVAIFGFLVTLEALYSSRFLRNLRPGDDRRLFYRPTEVVVVLLLLKVFTEVRFGFDALLQNVIMWPTSFSQGFFTLNYSLNLVIVTFLWSSATLFAGDLIKLEDDILYLKGNVNLGKDERRSARDSLRQRFMSVGALVVFLAGIMRQSRFSLSGAAPDFTLMVTLVILYFLLGLVLLSLAHFANLRAAWGYEHVNIQKNMASRWILYFVLFLGFLVLVVLFLPNNYSMGLMSTFRFLFTLVNYLVMLIAFPFLFIISLIVSLFGGSSGGSVEPVSPPEFNVRSATDTAAPLAGWDVIRSVLFWVVFLAIIVFAFRQYILSNRRMAEGLRRFRISRWVSEAWVWVRSQFRRAGRGIGTLVAEGLRRLRDIRPATGMRDRWQYLNPGSLDPRQKILFFYATMLRRAAEAGTPRRPWQTPGEYSQKLKAVMPEEQEDITLITESFMSARYSRADVSQEQAGQIRKTWHRLLAILRQRRRDDRKY